MSQSLGDIYVSLTAETGGFVSALSKAAASAQQTARQVSSEFSGLQRVASQTFGAFGTFDPAISRLTFALSEAGQAAAGAMREFSRVPGAIAPIISLSTGAAAGIAALSIGFLGIAAEAAESTAKLYELSQSTGVNVETLSRLSFAAKQTGVDQQDLAKWLEILQANMLKSATAPKGVADAFSRLGISVRDASGQLKSASAIIPEIAGKLSDLQNSSERVGFARQLGGRGGDTVLPMLMEGKAGMQDLMDAADRLNVTISDATGQAAEHFARAMGQISAAASGLRNVLMIDLLGSLQAVADAMEHGLEDSGSGLRDFISGAATLGKVFLATGETIFTVLRQDGIILGDLLEEILEVATAEGKLGYDWATRDFSGMVGDAKDAYARIKAVGEQFLTDSKKDWSDYATFTAELAAPPSTKTAKTSPKGASGLAVPGALSAIEGKDTVRELVEKLQAQTSAELALAAATGLSAAALVAQKAAGDADAKTAETRTELLDRERNLQTELANAKANQQGPETARIQAEIDGVKKLLGELSSDVPTIHSLYQQLAAAQESVRIGGELSKEGLGFSREISSLQTLIAAYKTEGAAVAGAGIEKQLEEDKQRVAELLELVAHVQTTDPFNIPALTQLGGALNSANAMLAEHRAQLERIRSLNIDAEIGKQTAAFREESAAIADLNAAYLKNAAAVAAAQADVKIAQFKTANPGANTEQLARMGDLYRQQSSLNVDTDIAKQTAAFRDQAAAISELNAAYLQNAASVREAQVGVKVAQFKTENPGASDTQISAVTRLYRQQSEQAHATSIAEETASYEVSHSYDEQIDKLERIRDNLTSNGQSSILADAAIYEEQQKNNEQLDQAADKVGTLGERYHAFLDELQRAGANPIGESFKALESSLDSLSGTLARFITTGKNGFREWGQQLTENLLKAQIQGTIGQFASLAQRATSAGKGSEASSAGIPDVGSALAGRPAKPPQTFFSSVSESVSKVFGLRQPGAPLGGSQTNPMYVAIVSGLEAARAAEAGIAGAAGAPGASGAPGSAAGLLSQLGKAGSATTPAFLAPSNLGAPLPPAFATSGLTTPGALSAASLPLDRAAPGFLGLPAPAAGSTTSTFLPPANPPALSLTKPPQTFLSSITDSAVKAVGLQIPNLFGSGNVNRSAVNQLGTQGMSGLASGPAAPPGAMASVAGGALEQGASGIVSSLLKKLFGGFLAGGGDTSPGKAYVVGEHGPEIFTSKMPGTILPNSSLAGFRADGGNVSAGRSYMVGERGPEPFMPATSSGSGGRGSRGGDTYHNVTMNIHGVQDADSFRRSQAQIYGEQQKLFAAYSSRNG